jgi:uncharacterized protein YbbK (DUF523 family)
MSSDVPVHLGVSACLLGARVRYDARDKRLGWLLDAPAGLWRATPVCPEVDAGLGTPREPMTLMGDPAAPRLVGNDTGADHTAALAAAVEARLRLFATDPPELWLLKAKSPSCGVGTTPRGALTGQDGLFAEAVARRFPDSPRADETTLSNFRERSRIFAILRTRRRAVALGCASLDALEAWLGSHFGG